MVRLVRVLAAQSGERVASPVSVEAVVDHVGFEAWRRPRGVEGIGNVSGSSAGVVRNPTATSVPPTDGDEQKEA